VIYAIKISYKTHVEPFLHIQTFGMEEFTNAAKAYPNSTYIKLRGAYVYATHDSALDGALELRALAMQEVEKTHHVLVDPEAENNGFRLQVLLIRRLVK